MCVWRGGIHVCTSYWTFENAALSTLGYPAVVNGINFLDLSTHSLGKSSWPMGFWFGTWYPLISYPRASVWILSWVYFWILLGTSLSRSSPLNPQLLCALQYCVIFYYHFGAASVKGQVTFVVLSIVCICLQIMFIITRSMWPLAWSVFLYWFGAVEARALVSACPLLWGARMLLLCPLLTPTWCLHHLAPVTRREGSSWPSWVFWLPRRSVFRGKTMHYTYLK